jgi:hypothetical protein
VPMPVADGQAVNRPHLQDVGGGCHPSHGSFSPSCLAISDFVQRQKRGSGGCLRTVGHVATVNSLRVDYIRKRWYGLCNFSAWTRRHCPKLVDLVSGTCRAPFHRRALGMAAGHPLPRTSSTSLEQDEATMLPRPTPGAPRRPRTPPEPGRRWPEPRGRWCPGRADGRDPS